MKKRGFFIISVPYVASNLFLFLFNLFFGEVLGDSLTYYSNSFSGENPSTNYFYLIYDLYFLGYVFVLISVFYLYRLKIKKSFIFGIVGTIIFINVALNSVIFYPIYTDNPDLLGNESDQLIIAIIVLLFCSGLNVIILIILRLMKMDLNFEDKILIKKIILDLGTKFTRLEIRDISEKSGFNSDSIIIVLNNMIENKEIFAEFFKSSNMVSFDQRSNIDEIDELMAVFKSWEEEHYKKLGNY